MNADLQDSAEVALRHRLMREEADLRYRDALLLEGVSNPFGPSSNSAYLPPWN